MAQMPQLRHGVRPEMRLSTLLSAGFPFAFRRIGVTQAELERKDSNPRYDFDRLTQLR
jgi:hypothetical protein